MANIISVKSVIVTTKKNEKLNTIRLNLDGKPTTAQAKWLKANGFSYFKARYDLVDTEKGKAKIYTQSGYWGAKFNQALYNALMSKVAGTETKKPVKAEKKLSKDDALNQYCLSTYGVTLAEYFCK